MSESAGSELSQGMLRQIKWWVWLAALFLLLAGAAVWWQNSLRHYVFPRAFDTVEPGRLFRSGLLSRYLVEETLRDHGIGLVIFMSDDAEDPEDSQAEIAAVRELGGQRINCHLPGDGVGDVKQYIKGLIALADARKRGIPALVHCHAGAQRTGGMIAFWQILARGATGREAYDELVEHGHDPEDNPKLIPYLNEHMAEVGAAMKQAGAIEKIPDPLPKIGP